MVKKEKERGGEGKRGERGGEGWNIKREEKKKNIKKSKTERRNRKEIYFNFSLNLSLSRHLLPSLHFPMSQLFSSLCLNI